MSVFSSASFDQHELVAFSEHAESGLKAIIAVHNSNLGPAVGGCRMFPYLTDDLALEDVLRLSRGMTYKSALAGLPMGGGKAVIIGDPTKQKSPMLLKAMGDFINSLGGKYVTAEDSGTSVADMKVIRQQTEFVSGVDDAHQFGGDPSPFTAFGIYCGIRSALAYKNNTDELGGVSIAIQGVGAVGRYLTKHLVADGAKVLVADINQANLDTAIELGARPMDTDAILQADVDVLAPCAMGAVINDHSLDRIQAKIIAGGANNQLADLKHGRMLKEKGILYAPDFVVNAGGIIEIHHQRAGTSDLSRDHIANIGATLTRIFKQSDAQDESTVVIAQRMAEEIFNNPAQKIASAYSMSNNA